MNEYIEKYLDYYLSLSGPGYAVLLKGPWGAGKTWFIKKYIKTREENNDYKFIYVSLYGVSTISEIEDLFFQQLHPILSSKGMEIAGKILKGVLKAAIKIDLDGDNKNDATITSQIPEIDFPRYLKYTGDCILIFDDLERCKIEIDAVLGYINYFVEHQGIKVVIIANEDAIINSEDGKKYTDIKEKLIGKTFQVVADIDSAIDEFISYIDDKETKDFLKKNKDKIKQIYKLSEYENLRNLKQSLWEFQIIYPVIPSCAREKLDLMRDILSLLLAYSFEIRHGTILPNEIAKFRSVYFSSIFSDGKDSEGDEKNIIKEIIKKYSEATPLHDPIPSERFWQSFFYKGCADESILKESLANSKYFQDENTPNWVKLWHLMELTDEEFDKILEKVLQEFEGREYSEIGIIKHVVGLLLWIADKNIGGLAKNKILESAKSYIDFLKNEGRLPFEWGESSGLLDDSYAGLGFFGKEIAEFQEFCQYIVNTQDEAKKEKMPEAGKELLEIMAADASRFAKMICISNSDHQIYYNTPIFNYIDPEEFVTVFLSLSSENRRTVIFALKERYKLASIHKNILSEIEWLKSVKDILIKIAGKRKGKLSGYILKLIADSYLTEIINILKNSQQGASPDRYSAGAS